MTETRFDRHHATQPSTQRQSLGLVDGEDMTRQLIRLAEEVRGPLSTILDMTDILLSKNLAEPERQHIETIRHAADSLLKS